MKLTNAVLFAYMCSELSSTKSSLLPISPQPHFLLIPQILIRLGLVSIPSSTHHPTNLFCSRLSPSIFTGFSYPNSRTAHHKSFKHWYSVGSIQNPSLFSCLSILSSWVISTIPFILTKTCTVMTRKCLPDVNLTLQLWVCIQLLTKHPPHTSPQVSQA